MKRMKGVSRASLVAFAVVTALMLLSHAALADGISEPAESDVLETEGISPDTALVACYDVQGDNADHSHWYRHFTVDSVPYDINLDEYDAPGAGSFPAVVLAHGGGWVGGCRNELDSLADKIRDGGYIVFNIDYRLACDPEVYDVPICGFNFSVPPDDARVAINWVRDNAHSYVHQQYQSFNGQVVAIGTSAGGNLMYEAAAYADVEDKPDVVAGASGHPEIGYMSNGHTACGDAYIPEEEANVCESGTEAYMGGSLGIGPYTGPCQDNWTDASPACAIDEDMPPTFIANGTDELVAFQAADDFATNLLAEIGSNNYQLCAVSADDGHLHGTHLLNPNVDCDGSDDSVFDNMMAFIASHLS